MQPHKVCQSQAWMNAEWLTKGQIEMLVRNFPGHKAARRLAAYEADLRSVAKHNREGHPDKANHLAELIKSRFPTIPTQEDIERAVGVRTKIKRG